MPDRLDQLVKLHEADPADPFVTYGIALEHAKADRPDEALAWLDKTLSLDAGYLYAYFQKAKALGELGEDAAARAAAERGIEKAAEAGDDKALSELTDLLESLG